MKGPTRSGITRGLMRSWQVQGPGGDLALTGVATPTPGPGECRVRILAAGLNFADLLLLQGKYQVRLTPPFTPGMEFSGIVEALGPGTPGPAIGTRVLGTSAGGAFAEAIVTPADLLTPLPDGMTAEEAAGFPIAYGTSHLALTHKARLQAGETLFVTGAAGGVGLTAVELGKIMGARVIASARGPERLEVARVAGADVLIDSEAPDLKEALRAAGGVDVVYDVVGGPAFDQALRATRPDGRLLTIGFASGEVPQIPANLLLVKNLTVSGLWYGGYQAFAPGLVAAGMAELLALRAAGRIRPSVHQLLRFEDLPKGLDLLRDRKATGKIVLRVA